MGDQFRLEKQLLSMIELFEEISIAVIETDLWSTEKPSLLRYWHQQIGLHRKENREREFEQKKTWWEKCCSSWFGWCWPHGQCYKNNSGGNVNNIRRSPGLRKESQHRTFMSHTAACTSGNEKSFAGHCEKFSIKIIQLAIQPCQTLIVSHSL